MENSLVSIIIPTHSGAEVIQRAVDSALAQTYDNVEVIVVDDNGIGSEGQIATANAMQKYSTISNVKYVIHETSRHGSAARNTGVKNSSGKFISLLDDDDYFSENCIEKHIEVLSKLDSTYAVSYCDMRLIKKEGESVVASNYNGNVLYDFLCSRFRVGSSLIVVKRNAWESVNGFDETFKRHQDWEFLVRLLHKYNICHVNNVGVIKVNLNRNIAKNPERFETNRIYYLEKMKYIIESLPPTQQADVYYTHYIDIAKAYLKSMNYRKCFYWATKTSSPYRAFFDIVRSGIVYLKAHL